MEMKRNNGWTNYETWTVMLWLDNDEASQRYWRTVAQETVQLCKRPEEHREEAPLTLAKRLKNEIHETLMGGITDPAAKLLAHALLEVDWMEIAEHMIAEIREEDDRPRIWKGPRPGAGAEPKFSLGQTYSTAGALDAVDPFEMMTALARHHRGDWGDCCPEDWESNEAALVHGSRLLSVYHTSDDQRFWIITEWDRSATTILLPSEY